MVLKSILFPLQTTMNAQKILIAAHKSVTIHIHPITAAVRVGINWILMVQHAMVRRNSIIMYLIVI